ncbi:MAG: roadblock/LC7 domain-containing protein [Candidatus Hodarchaeota archaeon]
MTKENSIFEKLEVVLKKLLRNNPSITSATISSIEGFPILSLNPRRSDEKVISAMVATLLSLSERAVIEMSIGEFNQLYIKGDDGYLLVFDAELAVLAVSTTENVKLGLIFLECERASYEISKILKREK